MGTRKAEWSSQAIQEKLKASALQVYSTQMNDETSIIQLITLAGQQNLISFNIQLPNALEKGAIDADPPGSWPTAATSP